MPIKHYWNGTILTVESDSGVSSMDLKGAKGDTGARGVRGLTGAAGGGATIEDNIISEETTWSSNRIMDTFAEAMSVSGNPVSCMPIPNYPLHIITNIEPKQEGSGEPYPAGGGKNLLENTATTRTINGVTFTVNADGTVNVNGNATADAWLEIKRFSADAPNFGGCVMSGCPAGGSLNTYFLRWTNNSTTSATDDGNSTCVIPDAHTGAAIIAICVKSGVTVSNLIFKPMICLVSISDATYQPYSNIRPISGMGEVNVTRCGKNIFNFDEWKQKNNIKSGTAEYSDNSITITATGDDCYTAYGNNGDYTMLLKENTTYTLSWEMGNNAAEGRVFVFFYNAIDSEGSGKRYEFVSNSNKTYTFTTSTRLPYVRIRLGVDNSGEIAEYKNIMLEEGSTKTVYEPYKGNTYTMYLPETIYGGSIDWNTGELIINRVCETYDGTEEWMEVTDNSGNIRFFKSVEGYDNGIHYIISSHYKTAQSWNEHINAINTVVMYKDSGWETARFSINPGFTSKTEWVAYLEAQAAAGTPLTVVYELAEPYTIQLTEQEIKAIKDTNILYTDADNLQVIGRVDTMYQLSQLNARIAALEAALINA